MDYFVWAVVGAGRTWVVDTGFDAAMPRRGRRLVRSVTEALATIDIDAATVTDVIITHLHYDHIGGHAQFPAARFHVQDREMAFATGRHMTRPALSHAFTPDHMADLVLLVHGGRVVFHDGDDELAPGLSLHHVGGHTDGLQVVRVRTEIGWLVLASDAAHYYENMDAGRPFPIVFDVGAMLEGFATVRRWPIRPSWSSPVTIRWCSNGSRPSPPTSPASPSASTPTRPRSRRASVCRPYQVAQVDLLYLLHHWVEPFLLFDLAHHEDCRRRSPKWICCICFTTGVDAVHSVGLGSTGGLATAGAVVVLLYLLHHWCRRSSFCWTWVDRTADHGGGRSDSGRSDGAGRVGVHLGSQLGTCSDQEPRFRTVRARSWSGSRVHLTDRDHLRARPPARKGSEVPSTLRGPLPGASSVAGIRERYSARPRRAPPSPSTARRPDRSTGSCVLNLSTVVMSLFGYS